LRHLRSITTYVTSVMLGNHNPANTRVTVGMLESARAVSEFLWESSRDVLDKLELHAVCGLPKMDSLKAIDRLYDLGDELTRHAGRLCCPAIAARVALIHRSVLCSIPAKVWPKFVRDPDIPLEAMLLPAKYISTSLGALYLKDEIPPAFKEPVRVEVDGMKMVLACRQDQICGSIVFPWQKGESHFFLDHHLLCLEASLSEDMSLRGCRFPTLNVLRTHHGALLQYDREHPKTGQVSVPLSHEQLRSLQKLTHEAFASTSYQAWLALKEHAWGNI
jgi:hypothetical protein